MNDQPTMCNGILNLTNHAPTAVLPLQQQAAKQQAHHLQHRAVLHQEQRWEGGNQQQGGIHVSPTCGSGDMPLHQMGTQGTEPSGLQPFQQRMHPSWPSGSQMQLGSESSGIMQRALGSGDLNSDEWDFELDENSGNASPEVGKPPYQVLPARLPPFTHHTLRSPFPTGAVFEFYQCTQAATLYPPSIRFHPW